MSTTKDSSDSNKVIGRDRAPMISYNVNGVHYTPRMEKLSDGTWQPCKGFRDFLESIKNSDENS